LRERQQQEREQAILAAAFDLLTTRGYVAMTMDEVAASVGISKATLYQHFPSKEELTVAVVVGVLRQMEALIAGQDPALPADERLRDLMRWVVRTRHTVEGAAGSHVSGGLFAAVRAFLWPHPRFQEQKGKIISALCALVQQGQAEGTITEAVPARVIVQAILALVRDFDYAELLASAPISGDELAEALVAILWQGIGRRV
jgi:AcrR family transcriptional regulator